MKNFIEVRDLCKSYNSVPALKSISFSVEKDELFGFIGADGAGKTTIFEIMTTLLLPDSGTARIGQFDVLRDFREIRSSIGYMPGKFSLYQDLTVEENLQFFARVFQTSIKENYEMIESIYKLLEPFKQRTAGALSGGMKQKLALCCALIRNPDVLFLDEPTTGVDPVSRTEFWQNLQEIKKRGITIIVSTPYMDEAEQCDRVALINKGSILDIQTPQQIINSFGKTVFSITVKNKYALLNDLKKLKLQNYDASYAFGEKIHLITDNSKAHLTEKELTSHFKDDHEGFEISRIEPAFEDCFLKFLREEDAKRH